MISSIRNGLQSVISNLRLSEASRREIAADRGGIPEPDPGADAVIEANLAWLLRAQDCSASQDGGVARHYDLESGWAPSYPETTGYIIPTILECAEREKDDQLRERAKRMLEWLASIQLPDGGFQGGVVGASPCVSVTFNTGQILLGLAEGKRVFGSYEGPLVRAADWLIDSQDPDGAWRRNATPFASRGDKTYETHVAWGLLEAARATGNESYAVAALANIDWALRHQGSNGWMSQCSLDSIDRPLTHTLGYALRGIIEGYLYSRNPVYLAAARRTADGLLGALRGDGYLPGRLRSDWSPAVTYVCLTGTAQIAICWLLLFRETGDERYRSAARIANGYVRRTVRTQGNPDLRGAVKGSFPVDGGYGRFQFLNWACKFCLDAHVLEKSFL